MDAGLTHLLLLLGVVVVAPVTLRLHRGLDRRVVRWAVIAGVLAGIALVLPAGPMAAGLVTPWAVLALVAVAAALPRTMAALRRAGGVDGFAHAVAPVAALAFWAVGAGWLLLDRLAVDPIGVGPDLVLLTAVHFHFAGLATTTVVAASAGGGVLGRLALLGTLAAPPLVAIGFVAVPVLQVLGAVVFTVALLAWSLQAGRLPGGAARPLWLVARSSVWVSMPLAVWWATGFVTGVPAPSIPVMAATHGVVNAIGFALAAITALSLSDRTLTARPPDRPAPGGIR